MAQDITAFGADRGRVEIAELLDALNAVEGIEWIRLLYAYPERITDAFIAAMTRNEKVLHYLDVPIQHINSEMLRAMNRRGDRETVLDALTRLRAAMPDITLRTTLITGYPGETQAQFEELCEFVKDYAFDRLGCFAYSEEEGTVAAGLPQLPQELREQRAEAVVNIQANVMARGRRKRWAAPCRSSATATTTKTTCISAAPAQMPPILTRNAVCAAKHRWNPARLPGDH